jgi:hypothetical protein
MPRADERPALVALSATDRQRALEQFYWLRPAVEDVSTRTAFTSRAFATWMSHWLRMSAKTSSFRYDPRDMAEIRVYLGDAYVCRAINPELAGETIALKDIIRALNQRRRELRSTLTDRQAMVDALLGQRAGADQEPLPIPPEPSPRVSEPQRRRLKRYYNE